MDECAGCRSVRQDAVERDAALKELIMQRIDALEKMTDARIVTNEKALDLQTRETERRLTDLNGEAGRLRMMQATYIPREVFDHALGDTNKSLNVLNAFKDTSAGRQSMMVIGYSAGFAVLGFLLQYFLRLPRLP